MINPFPKHIKRVAFLSLATTPNRERIDHSSTLLESFGIDVVLPPNIFNKGQSNILPSPIEDRISDLHTILKDRSVDLIISTRGGYGSGQLLDFIDWDLFKKSKILLLGYSDITALQLAMITYNAGIPIASPLAKELVDVCNSTIAAESLNRALTRSLRLPQKKSEVTSLLDIIPKEYKKLLKVVKSGSSIGRIIPVNLAILISLIGTKYLPNLKGSILLIEDIDEPIYKIDRMLTQLEQTSIFANCAGVCFGDFKDCGDDQELDKLFAKFATSINGPVISGIPFGHTFPSLSFVYNEKFSLVT